MQQLFFQLTIPLILIAICLVALWRIRIKSLKKYYSQLFGTVEVVQKYNGEKMLTINSYPQSVSTQDKSINQSYWSCVRDQTIRFCQDKKNPGVLLLGLGGNTIPNLISKTNPEIYFTIVEIDKAVIQACRDFFYLDKLPNYQLIQTDAYKLLEEKNAFKNKFDVIIVDVYIGKPPFVALESSQPGFISQVQKRLKPNGLIIFNWPGHNGEAREDSIKLQNYLRTIFRQVNSFSIDDSRGFKNNVITATNVLAG